MSIQRLDPKVLLLVSELAEMADVSADTVYREIKAGNLRVRRIRGCVRVHRAEAARWLAGDGPAS